jgi:Mobilization protein NikA
MAMLNFEVTTEEEQLIKKAAKKEGVSVSDFARSCIYLWLVTTGNTEAIRLLGGRLRHRMTKAMGMFMQSGVPSVTEK